MKLSRISLDQFFEIENHGTSVSKEVRAGLTTFMAMAYILFVNPQILVSAIPLQATNLTGQLLTATALAAFLGSMTMGLIARYPFALAPGMGLNAYLSYTVIMGMGVPWTEALGLVFVSGIVIVSCVDSIFC